jgi:hypothetical protein
VGSRNTERLNHLSERQGGHSHVEAEV